MRIWVEVCVWRPSVLRNFGNGRGSVGQKKIMVIFEGLALKKDTQSKANLGTNSAVGRSKVERKLDGFGWLHDLLNKY